MAEQATIHSCATGLFFPLSHDYPAAAKMHIIQDKRPSPKIWFADILRGFAALLVVVSHITVPLWPSPADQPAVFSLFGQLGVSLFFIISGFVIPMTLKNYSVSRFLIGRFLRIYPTYAAGFSVTLALMCIFSPIVLTWNEIIGHYFIIQDYMGTRAIDGVIWTLEVEIKFYIICAIFAMWIRKFNPAILFVVGSAISISLFSNIEPIVSPARWMLLMFIGVSYNWHYNGKISGISGFSISSVMFLAFSVSWIIGMPQERWFLLFAYAGSQAIFLAFYILREKIRPMGITKWMSKISYPLYVVHVVLANVAANLAHQAGAPWLLAVFFAFFVVIFAAWAIHILVEQPTHRIGQRLRKRVQPLDHSATAGRVMSPEAA